jgi:hypothetical protein
MKQVVFYACSHCDATSTDKGKMAEHEISCEKACIAARKRNEREEVKQKELEDIRLSATSWKHLEELVNLYAKKYKLDLTVNFSHLEYNPQLSNSHNCPIKGVQNWCGQDKNKPASYPGYLGHVTIYHNSTKFGKGDSFLTGSCDGIKVPGINTGTGGGSGNTRDYALYLYLQDFPLIEAKVKRAQELAELEKKFKTEEYLKEDKMFSLLSKEVKKDKKIKLINEERAELDKELLKIKDAVNNNSANQLSRQEELKEIILKNNPKLKKSENTYGSEIQSIWASI